MTSADSLFVRNLVDTTDIMRSMEIDDETGKHIGSYLMIDTRHARIIWSGGTTTSYKKRNSEHERAAKLETESSKKSRLYTAFPNPDGNVQASGPFQRGMWTDLKTVTGVSWQIGKIAVR